jgi:hypothetical protein
VAAPALTLGGERRRARRSSAGNHPVMATDRTLVRAATAATAAALGGLAAWRGLDPT